MELGQYTVDDGKFRFRYIVRKVMKKTCVVSILDYMDRNLTSSNTHYRYSLDLLEQQIKDAEYLPI